MILRTDLETREKSILSPFATLSVNTKGRLKNITPCPYRTEFQRDRDRIIHAKSFRRLKQKTQVYISPHGDHFRTRLTHTLEVSQIARTIGRGLALNEDLIEAIALGHDLGHTPFGHSGERVLNRIMSGGFEHNQQSLRVCDVLENDGMGLNLTAEVRDGILNHRGENLPYTLEGKVVRIADRIAYVNHDLDDSFRCGLVSPGRIPDLVIKRLGDQHGERINTLVSDIIITSDNKNDILQSDAIAEAMTVMREFLFETVYLSDLARSEEGKIDGVLRLLFKYYLNHIEELPSYYTDGDDCARVKDYIAGMTDSYAISQYQKLFVPVGFFSDAE